MFSASARPKARATWSWEPPHPAAGSGSAATTGEKYGGTSAFSAQSRWLHPAKQDQPTAGGAGSDSPAESNANVAERKLDPSRVFVHRGAKPTPAGDAQAALGYLRHSGDERNQRRTATRDRQVTSRTPAVIRSG